MRIGSLFSGYGGLDAGVRTVLGGSVAWHSDIDPGAARILAHRYPGVPNLGDITAVDWSAAEPVDVLTGGFPCQDVSIAGRRAGIRPDTRSGLWEHFGYAIDRLRPGLVVIENVRGLLSADAHHPGHGDLEPCDWCVGDAGGRPLRALGAVLGQLADLGYDASWQGLRASDVGAPHGRFRLFVIAYPRGEASDLRCGPEAGSARRGRMRPGLDHSGGHSVTDPDSSGLERRRIHPERGCELPSRPGGLVDWGPYAAAIARWERLTRPAPSPTEPNRAGAPRLAPAFAEWMMGLPAGWVTAVPGLNRAAQLKALGNGVVPQQAAAALRLLLPDAVTFPDQEYAA